MATREHGGILYLLNEQTWGMVHQHLHAEGSFTDAVPAANYHRANDDLVVIIHELKVVFAGLISSGGHGVTARRRIQIKSLVPLQIPLKILRGRLSDDASGRLEATAAHGGGTLDIKSWGEIWGALCELTTKRGALSLRDLETRSRVGRAFAETHLEHIIAFDRDSVGLAVDFAGFDRRRVLKRIPVDASKPQVAVRRPELCPPTEDGFIIYDSRRFPGFPSTLSESVQGGVVLGNPHGEQLHIINVNRTTVEEALGVDLLYYCEDYGSFILVQYKRLTIDGNQHYYRASGVKELRQRQKMIAAQRALRKSDRGTSADFRLGDESVFYKLCYQRRPRSQEELIPGCYFSIEHWGRMLADESSLGPRDGRVVTINKSTRHLANTEFSTLVRHGWIGSRGIESKHMESIITSCLEEKHSVTVAYKTRGAT